ncbi:MAG: c-type cytochrome [Gemmataceae bacterium]|nr:c-type cytochrome [Gemmataceae bacterium]
MIRIPLLLAAAVALCCAAAWAFQPGDPFKPGKLSPAEQAALAPGLTLRFYAKPGDAKPLDTRRIRLAALHIPKDSPPSPFLVPGPIHAKISGYLKNQLKGTYSFRLTGTGKIVLRINDKEVLKNDAKEPVEVELAKNYNRIEILYTSPATGDSTLRLDWSGEKFGLEPVPPEALFSRKDDADLVEKTKLREGRSLFANLHCGNCHTLPSKVAQAHVQMPELTVPWYDRTPRLDATGNRFQADWLAAWILDPRSLRPEATMPSVLTGPDAAKSAADIAAYLMLQKGPALEPFSKSPQAATGEAIFKKLGCNSCHRLDDPKTKDELGRLSLHHVAAKFSTNALQHFLKEPHKRYQWTRMPDFKLSNDETGHLEAYLRDQAIGKIDVKARGDAFRGGKLIEAHCSNCHMTSRVGTVNMFEFAKWVQTPIKNLDLGCLATKDRGKAPGFALNETDRAALTAFLKTDGKSLTRETPAEFSQRQVKTLRCDSCHRRDGETTRWHTVLEDEGKVPENLPSLTWIGEKLKPAWTKKLLAGQSDHSARPWIKGRMPAFPARAEMLAVGLSHEHGFGIDEDKRPRPDAKLAAVGEKLIPQQGGFNCINCHGIGKTPAIQPFEAPGINLLDAAIRLRYGYYQRWMLAPDRVDVTMRMPVFATDGKTTQLRDVFDGDARQQYDALWHYIQTLPANKK